MSVSDDAVLMEVKGLVLDPSSNAPIIILKDLASRLFLPIWIGVFEANAIAIQIEGVEPPRPLTHDLFHSTLTELGATIQRVVISDLKDNTFFAQLFLNLETREVAMDSRPSDAIALALRSSAPIYVLPKVLESARALNAEGESDSDSLKRWFENLETDDLGKYKM
ncbi:MAG TPA: bifunctional nuclease family protein [Thermoanaerobaculia bacterium]|nr:bifunctional nuclease family protein [Thermoanaerobaculia bacterium]